MADQTKHTDDSSAHASSTHTDKDAQDKASHAHASSTHTDKNTQDKASHAHASSTHTDKDAQDKASHASSVPSVDQIEKKMDTIADDLTHKIEESISPELTSKGKHIVDSFDHIIDQIEGIIVDIVSLIPVAGNISKNTYMINADYQSTISRLFIFRRLRLIIQYPIVVIWSMWITIIFILQLCNMLLLGKRNQSLRNRMYRFMLHVSKRSAYIIGFVDERPAILIKLPS